MAIWPFGRKGKRPRSQMKASDATLEGASHKSVAPEPALVARKPSRKRSKRDKHRTAGSLRQPSRAATDPATSAAAAPAPFSYNLDNCTSGSSIGQDNFAVARHSSLLQKRPSSTTVKGSTLKKRLSKRTAQEIQREREIKALSSSPPAHPATTWGYLASDVRRGPSVQSHNRTSNQSLPLDSRSSLSDSSDLYTYKVNALAVFAPRPIIRYGNHGKQPPPRSTNPSSNSMRKDFNPVGENDWNSHKRVAELADDLDAPALRELLERDRRRRDKKRLEDQERRQRRLQRRLDREHEAHQSQHENPEEVGLAITTPDALELDDARGRDKTPSPATSSRQFHPDTSLEEDELQHQVEEENVVQPGSWLREPSKDSQQRENRFSDISAHVIGNIDDRSIRANKQGHDVNPISEGEASRNLSPPYLTAANDSSAHMSSLAHESISDLSRTANSEKRLSDTSSRRMANWISFFRRPSLRKRKSKEVDAPPSEFSNTSRDSFIRAQLQSGGSMHKPAVPIPIPERSFQRTNPVYRSQSKFVEHLGDYPISPPDSRMQSPVPVSLEPVSDMAPVDESEAAASSRQSFSEGDEDNLENNNGRSRPMSWEDTNSAVLSKSLASIDSEGSWMSGSFLRRISQQNNANYTSWRSSTGKKRLIKYADDGEIDDEDGVTSDDYLNELAEEASNEVVDASPEVRRASSTAMGLAHNTDAYSEEDSRPSSNAADENNTVGFEKWHGGLERTPTVVRNEPGRARKISKEVVLDDLDMLDSSSVDNGSSVPVSPISQENEPVEVNRATSVDYGRGSRHARQMSAGSAKLLDIPPRSSVDSSRVSQ